MSAEERARAKDKDKTNHRDTENTEKNGRER
jgi:hypothetical protein